LKGLSGIGLEKDLQTCRTLSDKSDSISFDLREEANETLKTNDYFGSLLKYNAR
jgi:hypothetical protein